MFRMRWCWKRVKKELENRAAAIGKPVPHDSFRETAGGESVVSKSVARLQLFEDASLETAGLPRRIYFWTLPVAVFGSSDTNWIGWGHLKCAR